MKSLKPALLLAIVFVAGILCGVVGTRIVVRHVIRTALLEPEIVWTRLERKLGNDLGLTPEQRTKAAEAMTNARKQFQQLRADSAPRYRAIMEKFRTDLSAVLTPEQQARFEKLRTERPLLRLIDNATEPVPIR